MKQYAGLDVGKEHAFGCVLDLQKKQLLFPEPRQKMSLKQTGKWLQEFSNLHGACIDSPPGPNTGKLQERLPDKTRHNTDRRLTEFQLGIGGYFSTRKQIPQPGDGNDWMKSGFDLFQILSRQFNWDIDRGTGSGQLIETHPTYAFKALLGTTEKQIDGITRYRLDPEGRLRTKGSKTGKCQRIELLEQACRETGIQVDDAVTSLRNQRIDWADAAICAFMSYWHHQQHPELTKPGHPEEGTIHLRIPRQQFRITEDPVSLQTKTTIKTKTARRSKPPSRVPRLNCEPQPPNAIILKLSPRKGAIKTSTDVLSELDTTDTVLSSLDLEEFWFPVGSKSMKKLKHNLDLVEGRLFLAWENRLRIEMKIDECREAEESFEYPFPDQNPWPLTKCHRWLKVDEAWSIDSDNFLVNHSGEWRSGFTKGQGALLRARVDPAGGGQ